MLTVGRFVTYCAHDHCKLRGDRGYQNDKISYCQHNELIKVVESQGEKK
jgi:hypothetical protein